MTEVLHSGVLTVKKGKWQQRLFNVQPGKLVWFKEDDQTEVDGEILLTGESDVRNLKFGLKKFMFEVTSGGKTLSLAAAGDAEKLDWIQAIEAAANGGTFTAKGGDGNASNRKSVKGGRHKSFIEAQMMEKEKQAKEANDSGLESILGSMETVRPPSGKQDKKKDEVVVVDTPTPAGAEAALSPAERIQAKLGGNVSFVSNAPKCGICSKKVLGIEQVVVDGKKLHKNCFRCVECDTKLTTANFSMIENDYYCRPHYLQKLRSSNGKKIGDAAAAAISKAQEDEKKVDNVEPKKETPRKSLLARVSKRLSKKLTGSSSPSSQKKEGDEEEEQQEEKIPEWKRELEAAKQAKGEQEKEEQEDEKPSEEEKPKEAPKRLSGNRISTIKNITFGAPPPDLFKKKKQVESDEEEQEEDDEGEAPQEEEQDDEEEEQEQPVVKKKETKKTSARRPKQEASTGESPEMTHAVLNRPVMHNRRRRPQQARTAMQKQDSMTPPKNDKEKMTHELTFKLDNGKGKVIACHCSSQSEREQWTQRIASAIHVRTLEEKLKQAQRKDMMSSLQAQAELENHLKTADMTYYGYLEKLNAKGRKGGKWKKRYFELKDMKVCYYADEKKKKVLGKISITAQCAVLDVNHKVIKPQF